TLVKAATELKRGLQYCTRWRQRIAPRSPDEERVDQQEFRLICKLIMANEILEDDASTRLYKDRYEELKEFQMKAAGMVKLLSELSDAYFALGQAKTGDADYASIQKALSGIRELVQRNAITSLDREPAELLLAVAN